MTNPSKSGIILKHPEIEGALSAKEAKKVKFFEKSLKNLLTSSKKCAIMIELSEVSGFRRSEGKLDRYTLSDKFRYSVP